MVKNKCMNNPIQVPSPIESEDWRTLLMALYKEHFITKFNHVYHKTYVCT